ncbi:hypothetical protein OZX68_03245 [Streptococcaceae bacterium ESL0729]|nr:hypothetical protein OZX68_03245 [Streptococcaceae bacterium ESL0729]
MNTNYKILKPLQYENILNNYNIFFEGVSQPIFYKKHYPSGENENNSHWDLSKFVWGLKFKDELTNLAEIEKNKGYFDKYKEEYYDILREFINTVISDNSNYNFGIVAIPSSTKNFDNMVTRIIRNTVDNSQVVDLTSSLIRTKTKLEASKGGDRTPQENIETLRFDNKSKWEHLNCIIVVDDVVTTGNSFEAAATVLKRAGFKGEVINFSFTRTLAASGIDNYDDWQKYSKEEFKNKYFKNKEKSFNRIKGVIFDLDQTLLNPRLYTGTVDSAYDLGAIKEFTDMNIPFAILTNANDNHVKYVKNIKRLGENFPYKINNFETIHQAPREYFGNGEKDYYFEYKPSIKGIKKVLKELSEEAGLLETDRIVGLGNTPEDMITYRVAGLECCLALWGIPKSIREYARTNWKADYYFDSLRDFNRWVEESGRITSNNYDSPFGIDNPFGPDLPSEDLPFDSYTDLPNKELLSVSDNYTNSDIYDDLNNHVIEFDDLDVDDDDDDLNNYVIEFDDLDDDDDYDYDYDYDYDLDDDDDDDLDDDDDEYYVLDYVYDADYYVLDDYDDDDDDDDYYYLNYD